MPLHIIIVYIYILRNRMSKIVKKEPFANNLSKINSILSTSFTKKGNKSLITTDGQQYIQLSQSQVNFINTDPNQIYEISFTARNVSQKSWKLKMRKPKSEFLSVNFDKDGALAPGLQRKIIVTFNSEINEQIKDKLLLYCQDEFEIEVPVSVYPIINNLSYEPFINFGFLKINHEIEHPIKIINKGHHPVEIKLEPQVKGAKVVVEPAILNIQPNSEDTAILHINSNQLGDFEGTIEIFPQILGESNIEIVGTFCEFSKFIADKDGKQLSELHVKSLFGGQKWSSSFNLINNTPKPCQFRIIRKRGSDDDNEASSLITPQQFGQDDQEKTITFSTIEGQIEPHSKKQILCDIIAKIDESDQQLFCNYIAGRTKLLPYESKEWSYLISATFKDEETTKNLIIKGESVIPKLSLSSIFFKFNDCPIRSKQQKILKVENLSDRSVFVTVERSQNFKCLPESFEVPKDGAKQVIISFSPKVVGELNEICHLKTAMFSFPIKMLGKGIFVAEPSKKGSMIRLHSIALDQSRGVEVSMADADKHFLEQQISIINDKSIYIQENSKITTTNFDCTVLSHKSKVQNKNLIRKKAVKNRNGKEVVIDMGNFNPDEDVQQFPGINKNSQEQRLVSRELTLHQFKNIPVGPVILDFGEIFISAVQKKTFHICNLNSKPISIQMETRGNPEFEKSSKNIQVLPGESHAGFKVVYQAMRQGQFKHSLQYIINGRHYFEMLAVGTAILPTVQPSKTEFKFLAGEDDHTFEKKEILTLNNTYPYEVQYAFNIEKESLFKVNPSKGKIEPNGKQNIVITHNFLGAPEGGGKSQQYLRLKIKNGRKIDIKCVSIVPDCYVICKPSECNFKELSIFKQHEMKFSIRNSSKNFTVFKIVPNKDIQELVEISNSKTILATDEVAEVSVKLMSPVQQTIDSFITVIVRGGRKINIPIKANLIAPKIRVQGQEINFGSMPMGSNPTPKQISLVNQSSIPAEIQLILPYDSFLSNCLAVKYDSNEQRTVFPVKEVKERKAKIYTIKIAKKCKAQVCLQFQPQQVKYYKFILPFYLAGSTDPNPSLQKTATCRSLRNKLLVDHKQLDFGKTIIEQNLQNIPKNIIFTLSNPLSQSIEWWTHEKNLQPFSLQVKKGVIEGKSEIKIKALFYSETPGTFEKQLNFFVNNSDFEPSRPYLKLPIKATANYPQIYFDRPYVILPTVGLNQQSVAKFEILNGGYQNLNLKHVISQEYTEIGLNVKYLNGCHLGITKKSIPIQLSFKSEKPISFTLKVDFYDHHNRVFSIFVSGTADNSLYSLPQTYWQPNPSQQLTKGASFLINFLNSVGFVQQILYDFPDCLSQNEFQNFQRLLQHYSAQNEKLQKMRSNPKKTNTLQQNYEYISQVIKILKAEGAFLNEIRPQFLFSQDQFTELIKIKSENSRIFSNYKLPTGQQFKQLRLKSWIVLIYQMLKVYSRVTSKKKNTNNDFWSQMAQKQRIIINWFEQCYQSEAGLEQVKSSEDLKNLGDGEMLSALITKYTNIKILDVYGKPSYIFKEKEKRCKKIIQTFTQIGIIPGVRAQDLLRSKPIQMLVFLERLYNILPHYLQKGQPVVFSCAMGQSLTKIIQIKNPSKFPVTYIAKIEGSKAYVIENEPQFSIQPKQKHEIQVKYISNVDIDKNNATLSLTGKSSSKFTPSTFIFVLKSVSLGRISEKNIQISGQLYQPYEFQLNVKNNFPVDTNFNVQIVSTIPKLSSKSLYCTTPVVKIKKDEIVPVMFVFFPFSLQTHKFQILFKDAKVGEFQYDLRGLVDMPQVMPEPIRLNQTFFTNKPYTAQITIPQRNQDIIRARKQIDSYLEKVQKKNQNQMITQQRRMSNQSITNQPKTIYPLLKPETYSLSLVPQTDMVILKTQSIMLQPEEDENAVSTKKVVFDINMKMPAKDAPMFLIMKNASNNDIRRYKILINSVYKPLRYELQMKVPVGQSFTQPLPLINISNEPNTFNAILNSNESANNRNVFVFNNQKDIIVKPKEQSIVNLTFSPKQEQTYTSLLKIENVTIGQIIEYEINAIGEEPIAETIRLEQKTSELMKHEIKMPFVKAQKCSVLKCTFSPNNIRYEKNFWYGTEASCAFKFEFLSKIPGIYQGKIQIQDENKINAYNVTIIVTQSVAGVIQVKSIERVKKEISISLEKGKWRVQNFNSNVIIPQEIQMTQTGPFKFEYCASKAGQSESQLIFKSQTAGYLKYLLKISIEEQPEKTITNMKAQLGKTDSISVQLQNPDNHSITITGICTNPEVFYYQPEGSFTIPPKSKRQVKFIYRPTCLQLQTGKIQLTSNSNLKWKYDLSGFGSLQNQQEIKQIDAEVGQQVVTTINFINPFQKSITIYTFLQNQNEKNEEDLNHFKLVTKNNKHILEYLEEIEIPIKFTPTQIKKYSCNLKVLVNEKIYWKYIINVRTIFKSSEEVRSFKLASRNKKEITVPFTLPHFQKQIQNEEKFKCVLTASDPNQQNLLKSTCRVVKDWEKLGKLKQGKIQVSVNFLSYRPFLCPFDFQIYLENGCKWVFKGQVEFTMPQSDDQFEIITEINKATSVMFRLNNRVKAYAKYKAYFTSDSDMQFSISPKSGELEPYGREGTQFEVTFAPTQYKNFWQGKIIIETEDSFWSYIVKGNLPHYVPPVGKSILSNSMARKLN